MEKVLADVLSKIKQFIDGLAQKKSEVAPPAASGHSVAASVIDLHVKKTVEAAEERVVVAESAPVEVADVEPAPVVVEAAVVEAVAAPVVTAVVTELATGSAKLAVPEDSALKRHFLTQLAADVAASLPAEPADSTLKRHYQQLLAAKIAEQLA